VRFDATGRVERRVAVPAKLVSSCCFGGDDLRDLVVTSQDNTEVPERRGSIFRLRTDLPGLPPPLARV
jgi:gluconolactonase